MSSVLKPKKVDSEDEEEEETVEYVEVTNRKEKKAILEAEKKGEIPSATESEPTVAKEKKPAKESLEEAKPNRKFINDDRERIYPGKVEPDSSVKKNEAMSETKVSDKKGSDAEKLPQSGYKEKQQYRQRGDEKTNKT